MDWFCFACHILSGACLWVVGYFTGRSHERIAEARRGLEELKADLARTREYT